MRTEARKRMDARAFAILAGVFMAAASCPSAVAQGCAMCYQTATAATSPAREALRHGILILLIPAASLFAGVLTLVWRRSNTPR